VVSVAEERGRKVPLRRVVVNTAGEGGRVTEGGKSEGETERERRKDF